ncbi:hypothetical protein MLD38_016078 [Melastoma candidum]|uniref:Uncharacterized protein n=1 Tax=Melastoma candidum TaxID=119954 RepID=A0ACB9RIE0_9MYRT|nr:hypothetical protein MLD38_016078 [Melastoma candidum]
MQAPVLQRRQVPAYPPHQPPRHLLPRGEEIHLVAMPSKNKNFPCFWCFSAPPSLYHSCLGLLNLRCLAIVFDLDETLIVAFTQKSFEDRIESLRGRIFREADMVRVTALSAELKRYADDRALLKQYADNDCATLDNGKVIKAQLEEVRRPSDSLEKLVRPVIRLEDENLVLTRINPEQRTTSVEVLFTGEKIGVGMGKTKKDAQQQAATNALHSLAGKYVAFATSNSQSVDKNFKKLSIGKDRIFVGRCWPGSRWTSNRR